MRRHLPLLAYKHAYVVTEPIPGLEGLPSIRDYNAAVYMKTSGEALHIGGYELDPIRLKTQSGWDMEDDFAFGLCKTPPSPSFLPFPSSSCCCCWLVVCDRACKADSDFVADDLDYDVFGVHLDAHINRVPAVGTVGIQSTVCGPESFTPDHKPLMGECPELRGFFVGCGLNSAGIMYSGAPSSRKPPGTTFLAASAESLGGRCGTGGFGRALAGWVVTGAPGIDIFSADVTRFHPECTATPRWRDERSHETYANQSVIAWPHDQPLGGRNVRQSPVHAAVSR